MTTASIAAPTHAETSLTAIVSALLVGGILIFGAGFAASDTVHDAAHDTRHSVAFPCH